MYRFGELLGETQGRRLADFIYNLLCSDFQVGVVSLLAYVLSLITMLLI